MQDIELGFPAQFRMDQHLFGGVEVLAGIGFGSFDVEYMCHGRVRLCYVTGITYEQRWGRNQSSENAGTWN